MRVFVSSTFKDLQSYRRVAEQVILSLGHEAEMVGALSGYNEEEVAEACIAKVERCDACVLILGFKLGSEPPQLGARERGLAAYGVGSFTSIELRAAQRKALPILVYILKEHELARSRREMSNDGGLPFSTQEHRVAQFQRNVGDDQLIRFIEPDPQVFRTLLEADLVHFVAQHRNL